MAIIGERPESPFSVAETEETKMLVDQGRNSKFTSKLDEKEDTINGMFELKFKKLVTYDPLILNFEKFRAEEVEGEGGRLLVSITPYPGPHGTLEFRHNRRKVAIGYLADTRFNRMQLAAQYLNNRPWDIEQLHTSEGDIPGKTVAKEIEALAIERRKLREVNKKTTDDRQVERLLEGLTPEARETFRRQFIKQENEKRQLIKDTDTPPEKTETPEPPAPPQTETQAPPLTPPPTETPDVQPAVKYSDLKKEAKKIVHAEPNNVVLINALKGKHGKHGWSNNERYREKIQPQIDSLVLELQKKSQEKGKIPAEEEVVT